MLEPLVVRTFGALGGLRARAAPWGPLVVCMLSPWWAAPYGPLVVPHRPLASGLPASVGLPGLPPLQPSPLPNPAPSSHPDSPCPLFPTAGPGPSAKMIGTTRATGLPPTELCLLQRLKMLGFKSKQWENRGVIESEIKMLKRETPKWDAQNINSKCLE